MSKSSHAHHYARCRVCHRRVFYTKALRCPHCGHRMRRDWKPLAAWVAAAVIAALLSLWLAQRVGVGDEAPPAATLDR